jgi:hypothetical protein
MNKFEFSIVSTLKIIVEFIIVVILQFEINLKPDYQGFDACKFNISLDFRYYGIRILNYELSSYLILNCLLVKWLKELIWRSLFDSMYLISNYRLPPKTCFKESKFIEL